MDTRGDDLKRHLLVPVPSSSSLQFKAILHPDRSVPRSEVQAAAALYPASTKQGQETRSKPDGNNPPQLATLIHFSKMGAPGLVEVGALSSQYTVALHQKCQAIGIAQPTIDFQQTVDQKWTGRASFPGLDIKELQNIQSKQDNASKKGVKELLSKRALELLEAVIAEGKLEKTSQSGHAMAANYTAELNTKHQKLALPKPEYVYKGDTLTGFSATVSFPGLGIESLQNVGDGNYHSSKNNAREAASKLALEALQKAEQAGSFTTPPAQKRDGLVENYVGQLNEFLTATSRPPPTYHDLQTDTRFTCLVEIPDLAQRFGSTTTLHTSKKAARQDAARHAIAHFKDHGSWPDSATPAGGIRKKAKTAAAPPRPVDDSSAHLLHHVKIEPLDSGMGAAPALTPASSLGSETCVAQVTNLAREMTLGNPDWRFTPTSNVPGCEVFSGACYFKGAGPLEGPLGEVRGILGRKRAKEECARLVLGVLQEERASRAKMGEDLLASLGL